MSEQTLASTERASQTATAALFIAAADQFATADFDVRSPAWGDNAYLTVTNAPGARCELTIANSGAVTWDYHTGGATPADRARVVGMVHALLAPGSQPDQMTLEERDLTFKGIVGRALARLGMTVTLQVLDVDQVRLETYCEICISNPARPERGAVRVSDQGTVWWDCRLEDPTADVAGLSLTDIVGAVVSALTPSSCG